MTDAPPRAPRLAETFAEVEDALLSRWPETRLEPSLDRIRAFTELLGDPQRAYPVIHLTGTNGKTSTSRMIDTLLRALDLRTGRFTSPHLERMNERICVDGEPLTDEEFVARLQRRRAVHPPRRRRPAAPAELLRDGRRRWRTPRSPTPRSTWPSSRSAWAAPGTPPTSPTRTVAVVTPIGGRPRGVPRRHRRRRSRSEKAGIIKPGATAVLAEQLPGPAEVLLRRCAEVGATPVREGLEFGGRLAGARGRRPDAVAAGAPGALRRGLPAALRRPPGAERRRRAGRGRGVPRRPAARTTTLVRDAFARATSPGRLEIIRRSPMILLDAAHNPHGAEAMAAALEDSFAFSPLIGVIGVMADKDVEGVLAAFEPHLAHVVVHPELHRPRAARGRARRRRRARSSARTGSSVAPRLADAIDEAHRARRGRRGVRDARSGPVRCW